MLPVVALVGHTNVGKSTLFNRLTRTRDALVLDFPGFTRDRRYGRVKAAGKEFICIDTGGIDGIEEGGVKTRIEKQSMVAIAEADLVLFVVDARAGLMPSDSLIGAYLRSKEKPTFLVANKSEGIDTNQVIADFWSLRFGGIYPVSACHGKGLSDLLEAVLLSCFDAVCSSKEIGKDNANWIESEEDQEIKYLKGDRKGHSEPQNLAIKLAIVGCPNVGKSTLANRILGEERLVVYDIPGTTRDTIYIPVQRDRQKYLLIDTAGVRKRSKVTDVVEKLSVIKTLEAIKNANVALLVIDAKKGISDQDRSLLGFVLKRRCSLVIAVNKWDNLSNPVKEQVRQELDSSLGFVDFARIHFISALHGNGVSALLGSVQEAYEHSCSHKSAAKLTRILNRATENYKPPLVCGRRAKPKYAHAAGNKGSSIVLVIHGNQVENLPNSYKRYLMNYFRKSLKVMGTPVSIYFKDGVNPFSNNPRTFLMLNKAHKRKCLPRAARSFQW